MQFITGATGFVGSELLAQLLNSNPEERFSLLVRPSRRESGEERIRDVLEHALGAAKDSKTLREAMERISVIEGDLSLPYFGLGETQFNQFAANVKQIYHCAASTSFSMELETARQTNVASVEQVLEFARRSNELRSLVHMSTAYVAGATEATVSPDCLSVTGAFRNSYEQSKAEAELLVRGAAADLPITIVRPSMVVGNSDTGATSAFNVIYAPARLFTQGIFRVLPAIASTPIDLVPVNYIASATIALAHHEHASGTTFHLCSGVGRESSLREVVEHLIAAFNNYRHRFGRLGRLHMPRFVSPELIHLSLNAATSTVRRVERLILDHMDAFKHLLPFLPYMHQNPRFDISQTTQALSHLKLNANRFAGMVHEPPLFAEYAERLFTYCLVTNWGRRKVTDQIVLAR